MTELSLSVKRNIVFKKLFWFQIASAALILSGFIVNENSDFLSLALVLWCSFIGVVLIYRLNDCIDQDQDLNLNIRKFLSYKWHKIILLQFIFITIPLSIWLVDPTVFFILAVSAIIGVLYSLNIKFGKIQIRLKNIFLVKNILIGFVWATLILIGAGTYFENNVLILFYFIAIQVFIGGMIRDIPDIEKDKFFHVKTFPVVFGISSTLYLMHIINVLSLLLLYLPNIKATFLIVIVGTVLWRTTNLFLLGRNPFSPILGQWMNLFTCVICFVLLLIIRLYEFYIL